MPVSPITTHVLDTATGRPASGLPIAIYMLAGAERVPLGNGVTNADGRITDLLPSDKPLATGRYLMHFDTATYFRMSEVEFFYPYVEVVFEITNIEQHYHVPLLLSPFGYSTYRGS